MNTRGKAPADSTYSFVPPGWRSRVQLLVLITIGVVVAVALVFRIHFAQHSLGVAPQGSATHGNVAPQFTVHTWAWWNNQHGVRALSGQTMQLSAEHGKIVVLNFWASWCVPCREEAPALEAASRKYQAAGVVFVGIDVGDTDSESAAFIARYGITYFNGPDVTDTITVSYAAGGIPTTVFIGKNGVIASRKQGALDATLLDSTIGVLLAGRTA